MVQRLSQQDGSKSQVSNSDGALNLYKTYQIHLLSCLLFGVLPIFNFTMAIWFIDHLSS